MFLIRNAEQQNKPLIAIFFLLLCFLAYGNSLRNNFLNIVHCYKNFLVVT